MLTDLNLLCCYGNAFSFVNFLQCCAALRLSFTVNAILLARLCPYDSLYSCVIQTCSLQRGMDFEIYNLQTQMDSNIELQTDAAIK